MLPGQSGAGRLLTVAWKGRLCPGQRASSWQGVVSLPVTLGLMTAQKTPRAEAWCCEAEAQCSVRLCPALLLALDLAWLLALAQQR